ncbi:MAG: anthranilate phosphoribosyltransferase [Armatimonadia bacterium]|nr:anthranilate phosphoribosyltransferase [Armatimonadia bacterium]
MINETLEKVVDGHPVDRSEAQAAMAAIMGGECTPAQIGAFLIALRMRGETVDQISGFAEAMRGACVRIRTKHPNVVDTCGTGGDAMDTFNISTAAALVTAAAGIPVAKHGNRSVSSKCGSADVLTELGVRIDLEPFEVEACLDEVNIGFLFAPSHHPAMKHAIGPRRELGMRTVFNVLGPLTNPAGARRQLLGVFDPSLTEVMAGTLAELGSEHALVVHGLDGLDEISTTGPTRVSELREGDVRTYEVAPEDFGLARAHQRDLFGGEPADSAEVLLRAISGEACAARDIVALNAGGAIYVGGMAASIADGIEVAQRTIDSGAAVETLHNLREMSLALAGARAE